MTRPSLLLLSSALFLASAPADAVTVASGWGAMGTQFEVTVVAETEQQGLAAIDAARAEVERIESRISSWRADSETSALNDAAGGPATPVSREVLGLVGRSLKIARLTGGAFDPTFAGAGRLWDFKADPPSLPDPDALEAALELVDHHLVEIDREKSTLRLPKAGMRIGFGGIGKGYAANRVARLLRDDLGIRSGLVDAGGDLYGFGLQETGEPWRVAIADPVLPGQVFARLALRDRAVVTSGDYERYVEIDGVRYAHILDPRTGWPVRGLRSVTVLCPDAELADALATAVFVMGIDDGLALVDQLRGIDALIVDDEGTIHTSHGLEALLPPSPTGDAR